MWLTGPEAVVVLPSPQLTVMPDPDIGRIIDSFAVVVFQVVINASGSDISKVIKRVSEAVLALPARSATLPAGMETVTSP